MNKEEIEKAKNNINSYIHDWLDSSTDEDGYEINPIDDDGMDFINNIQTLLQYIDQLEQENNKQNKMIDEMVDMISSFDLTINRVAFGGQARFGSNEEVKQYFEKKVEEDRC